MKSIFQVREHIKLQKTYTDENYNRHKNNGEEDQYKIIDNHEAIVSREEFEKVQGKQLFNRFER